MSVERIAAAHAKRQVALAKKTARATQSLWRRIDPKNIAASWRQLLPAAAAEVTRSQLMAAASSARYVEDVAMALGGDGSSAGRVLPGAFSGVASDGRSLDRLLEQPVFTALRGIGAGARPTRALTVAAVELNMLVRSQMADAGRVADGVAVAVRPQLRGYVRMLVGNTCKRCLILAGRRYEWNAGFKRHPRCLPAGVAVSGPGTLAATRRWFQGELVVITTAGGKQLPITGNHPVLTSRGWVPAHLVDEGDEVVRSTRGQGASALVVPGEDQVPARVEDLWRSDRMVTFDHVPTAAEDFHGDGGHGEVDVVLADRLLWHGLDAALGKFTEQEQLARRVAEAALLAQLGSAEQQLFGLPRATYSGMRGRGLREALIGSLATGADLPGCGHVADLRSGVHEAAAYGWPGDAEAATEAVFALSGAVRTDERLGVERQVRARWDPPEGPLTMQSRSAYAARGQDLRLRLAGQVELDRVIQASRVEWSGHVYNLTSVEGWYSANGLIVSNCDCRHVPVAEDVPDDVRTDPRAYFDALDEAAQDKLLGRAAAQAARDGADLSQLVNTEAGMTSAGTTTTGTTRYGLAGIRLGARQGQRVARLMPEGIYAQANGDRDEALRLLRLHGYIL